MTINHECLHDVTLNWARNLWALENPHKTTGDFYDFYFPAAKPDRGLTPLQQASEQTFVMACHGMAFGGSVSKSGMDALSNSRLVDAWRKSVLRNGGQQKFSKFEVLLADTIEKQGEQAALRQYPANLQYDSVDMPATLRWINYKAPRLGLDGIADLLTRGKAAVAGTDFAKQGWSKLDRKPSI